MEQRAGSDMGRAAADLRWYYAREATGPLKSSYPGMVHRIQMGRTCRELPRHDPADELLDDAARAGGIARTLRAVDATTEDHLRRGFGVDWPPEAAVIGDLSGLAPLTEAARTAHRRSEGRHRFDLWLHQLKGQVDSPKTEALLKLVEAEARAIRGRALAAYVTARRRVGCHGR